MLGSPAASTSSATAAAAAAAASFRSSLLHFFTIHRPRTCPSTSQPVPVACVRLQSCSSSRAAPPVKAMAAEAEILSAPDKELRPSSPRGKQALISLSDKTDLAFVGKGLQELGCSLGAEAMLFLLEWIVGTFHCLWIVFLYRGAHGMSTCQVSIFKCSCCLNRLKHLGKLLSQLAEPHMLWEMPGCPSPKWNGLVASLRCWMVA